MTSIAKAVKLITWKVLVVPQNNLELKFFIEVQNITMTANLLPMTWLH